MCEILIFGGTTEGRLLAEYCIQRKIPAYISVVSDYGKELLKESPYVTVLEGAMEKESMRRFIREHKISLVIDATHPYAVHVTENVKECCEEESVRLIRCLREEGDGRGYERITVSSLSGAVDFLRGTKGKILVTTGSRELKAFTALEQFEERIFARVLPSSEVVKSCEEMGISGKHLICMQGPFSREMNAAIIRQTGARFLVTKEAGAAGGFEEKLQAARDCQIQTIVIGRPAESGMRLTGVYRELDNYAEGGGPAEDRRICAEDGRICAEGSRICAEDSRICAEDSRFCADDGRRQQVILAGIGTGSPGQMTAEVLEAVRESNVLLGASRMLNAVRPLLSGEKREKDQELIESYQEQDVMTLLKRHPEWNKVTVLYSGDTGFCSGAKKMGESLTKEGISFRICPGISSVSAFAARLHTSWEDALLCTAHGREFDVVSAVRGGNKKIFLLLGGENGAGNLCQNLCEAGLNQVKVTVGENLSYPNERIATGTAETLSRDHFGSLCLILIEAEDR